MRLFFVVVEADEEEVVKVKGVKDVGKVKVVEVGIAMEQHLCMSGVETLPTPSSSTSPSVASLHEA